MFKTGPLPEPEKLLVGPMDLVLTLKILIGSGMVLSSIRNVF